MKETRISNDFYKIELDDELQIVYLTLFNVESSVKEDKNIANNILANCMNMHTDFRLILDLRYFDPRIKYQWFKSLMDRIATRLGEMKAGEQAHILSPIFWHQLYTDYPQLDGVYPVIFEDKILKKLIGRFSTIEEGEDWLASL